MTTPDAIAQLERNNDDLVLVRVAGSVKLQRLEHSEMWGAGERDEILRAAAEKAGEGR